MKIAVMYLKSAAYFNFQVFDTGVKLIREEINIRLTAGTTYF
jgi:hypothetical protein